MLPRSTLAILGGLLLVCTFGLTLGVPVYDDLDDARQVNQDNSGADATIQFSEFSYEDKCVSLADADWKFLHDPTNPELLKNWTEESVNLSLFKKDERDTIESLNLTAENSESTAYKLSLIQFPGDALLDDADFHKLVSFIGKIRVTKATTTYFDGVRNLTREDVESLLSHNGKGEDKLKAWTTWHQQFSPQVPDYLSVLHLAQKAAEANGKSDVKSYWEMLTGEEDGYSSFKIDDYETSDIRQSFITFMRRRLNQKYHLDMTNDSIPAHLLGSLSGYDWTPLALEAAPYPDVVMQIRKNFWNPSKLPWGKTLYTYASNVGKRFLGQKVGASGLYKYDFWTKSIFKGKCPSTFMHFCKKGTARVSACAEPSISEYLEAHKNIAKVLINQMTERNHVLNDLNRNSVLEEAVAEFFSLVAASPAYLRGLNLIDKSVSDREAKLTSLGITALDVLPRLAYYYSVDKWRLEALEKNETDSEQLISDWWSHRLRNEFVFAQDEQPPTFLDDNNIISNRPYLSKALGIALGFQIFNHVFGSTDVADVPFKKSILNKEFIDMVGNSSDNWKYLLEKYIGVTRINLDSMNYYFYDLKEFLQRESDTPYDLNAKEIELETDEKDLRRIASITTTTTTTTTTSTTPRPTVNSARATSSSPPDESRKSLSSTEKPAVSSTTPEDDEDDEEDEEAGDRKPKINTSKAVWAVAAVLVATITICIIAIFGRRRCSKTPKNRRYV